MYKHCRYEVSVRRRVQKWGNSLGIRIPKGLAMETGLVPGSQVELSVDDGRLVVEPVAAASYELQDLVANITEANRHELEEVGAAVGNEVW